MLNERCAPGSPLSLCAGRRAVGPWWRPAGDGQASVDFALAAAPVSDTFTFIHASDPHLAPNVVDRLAQVGEIAKARKAAFVITAKAWGRATRSWW